MRVTHLLLVAALVGCGSKGGPSSDMGTGNDAGDGRRDGAVALDGGGDGGGDAAIDVDATAGPTCGADRAPPTSMSRATRCIRNSPDVDCTDFEAVFRLPPTTSIRFFQIPRDTYVALQLDPGSPAPDARFDFNIEAQQTGDVPSGTPIWSLSTCPGDFNRAAVIDAMGDPDCFRSGTFARAGFRVGGADFAEGGDSRCGLGLPPGTTYYLNLTYSNDDPTTTSGTDLTWACDGSLLIPVEDICGHQIQATSVVGW